MSDDPFEMPAATIRLADGNDDFPLPFASDGMLAEIGLSIRAIRELRGFPPGAGADR